MSLEWKQLAALPFNSSLPERVLLLRVEKHNVSLTAGT